MDIWLYVYFVAIFIAGFIFGRFTRKKKYVATLFIDPVNPEVNGGVYRWEY